MIWNQFWSDNTLPMMINSFNYLVPSLFLMHCSPYIHPLQSTCLPFAWNTCIVFKLEVYTIYLHVLPHLNCFLNIFSGSDWHIGSRIMMTLSLILLFVLEFALIGYACIQKMQKYRSKLVGFIIAVSLSAGKDTFSHLHFHKLGLRLTKISQLPWLLYSYLY